jgi:ammonia channel protein AmtB
MGTTPVPPLNDGDISWVLASSALVLAMTAPGLAMFYVFGHSQCAMGSHWL